MSKFSFMHLLLWFLNKCIIDFDGYYAVKTNWPRITQVEKYFLKNVEATSTLFLLYCGLDKHQRKSYGFFTPNSDFLSPLSLQPMSGP